MPTPKT